MSDTVTLSHHLSALRKADEKFHTERDRRYTEVNVEKEKALKIKETADLAALEPARQIQTYKDEKANELREQINRERVLYATKSDVTAVTEKLEAIVKPLATYVASQQGRSSGFDKSWAVFIAIVAIAISVVSVFF